MEDMQERLLDTEDQLNLKQRASSGELDRLLAEEDPLPKSNEKHNSNTFYPYGGKFKNLSQ